MPTIQANCISKNLHGDLRRKAEIAFARAAVKIGGVNVMKTFETTKDDVQGAWRTIHALALGTTIAHVGHAEKLRNCRFDLELVG